MENVKLNQAFRSVDALTVVGAVMALFFVAVPIVGRELEAKNVDLAKNETNFLAERLSSLEKESEPVAALADAKSLESAGSRMIASVATPASNPNLDEEMKAYAQRKDPWGHPYNVQMIKNSYGQMVGIAVWSNGPDNHNDTAESALRPGLLTGELRFGGDDIGSVVPRR